MTDTNTIAEAQAPMNFDVLSFVEHTAYPTSEVTVYQNANAATQLVAANRERLENDKIADGTGQVKSMSEHADSKNAELTEKIETLTQLVKDSALTFELRGMPPGLVQEIYDEKSEKTDVERENELIASTIVRVRAANGSVDPRVWRAEDVTKLRGFLKQGEFGKLVQGVIDVNFNAAVFDEAVDAGFLSRGSDLAS